MLRVASARGSGLAASAWAADEEDFERLLAAPRRRGMTLIAARIADRPGVGRNPRSGAIRERFMRGRGVCAP